MSMSRKDFVSEDESQLRIHNVVEAIMEVKNGNELYDAFAHFDVRNLLDMNLMLAELLLLRNAYRVDEKELN